MLRHLLSMSVRQSKPVHPLKNGALLFPTTTIMITSSLLAEIHSVISAERPLINEEVSVLAFYPMGAYTTIYITSIWNNLHSYHTNDRYQVEISWVTGKPQAKSYSKL